MGTALPNVAPDFPRQHALLGMPAGILPPSFPIYCCGPSFLRFPCPLRFPNFHKEFSSICGNPFPCASLHRTGKAIVSNSVQKATCRYPLLRITACGILISTGINPHGSFRQHAPTHRSQRKWLRQSKQWFRPLLFLGNTIQSIR